MIHKTRATSIENARKFFTHANGKDVVTVEQALAGWGRPLDNKIKNMAWFSNMLSNLKYHALVVPIYSHDKGPKTLSGIKLTKEGKAELERPFQISTQTIEGVHSNPAMTHSPVNSSDIAKLVAAWKKDNPEFEVTFDIRLKGDSASKSGG